MLQKKNEYLTPVTINDLANEAMSTDYNANAFKRNVKRFLESDTIESELACLYLDTPFAKKLNPAIQNDAISYVNALVCAEARAKKFISSPLSVSPRKVTKQQYKELYTLCKGYANSTLEDERQMKLGKAVYDSVYMFHHLCMKEVWGPVANEGFYEQAMECNDKRILSEVCLQLSTHLLSYEVINKHFDAYKHIAYLNETFTEEHKKELFGALIEAYKQDFDSFMSPERLKEIINYRRDECINAIIDVTNSARSNLHFSVNNHGELVANGVAFAEALPEQRASINSGNYMDRSVLDYCRDKHISLLKPNSPDSDSFVFVRNGKEAEFNGTLKDLQPAKSKIDIEVSMF